MGLLDDRVALVTGAARGTGEAIARRFVAEGARVVLADILDEPAEAVAADLGDAARFVHLDVTDESGWQRVVRQTLDAFGDLHVLVNNAAVLWMAPIEETDLADFERVVRVNQVGTFLGMKAVIPHMKQAKRGSIVNVSSVDGTTAKNLIVAYAGSKWAVRGMTRVAALELGRHGIRVNAVCPEAGSPHMVAPYVPAGVDPELATSFSQPYLSTQRKRPNRDKLADIAHFVAFVASDAAASCTGSDFVIDGGNTAGTLVPGTEGGR